MQPFLPGTNIPISESSKTEIQGTSSEETSNEQEFERFIRLNMPYGLNRGARKSYRARARKALDHGVDLDSNNSVLMAFLGNQKKFEDMLEELNPSLAPVSQNQWALQGTDQVLTLPDAILINYDPAANHTSSEADLERTAFFGDLIHKMFVYDRLTTRQADLQLMGIFASNAVQKRYLLAHGMGDESMSDHRAGSLFEYHYAGSLEFRRQYETWFDIQLNQLAFTPRTET